MSDRDTWDTYEVTVHAETEDALRVSTTGDRTDSFWLPKSQIRFEEDDVEVGETIEVEIPDWLAEDRDIS